MSENIGENVRVPVNILCMKKECKSFRKYSGDCRRVENSRVSKIINSGEGNIAENAQVSENI